MSLVKCCGCGEKMDKNVYMSIGQGVNARGHKKCIDLYVKKVLKERDEPIIKNLPNIIGKPATWHDLPRASSVSLLLSHNETSKLVKANYCHYSIFWDLFSEENGVSTMTNVDAFVRDNFTVFSIIEVSENLKKEEDLKHLGVREFIENLKQNIDN